MLPKEAFSFFFKKKQNLFGVSNKVFTFAPRINNKKEKNMTLQLVNTYWWRSLQLRQS
ncbi:MAG: epimerase [Bacteroidia bacterium]|nr:epimerase [Bacteroidia bacterium]